MNDLWSLFFTLQLVCYLTYYDISLPSNSDLYVSQFTNIIEFKVLNPEGIIKIFDPTFNLKEFINGAKANVVSRAQTVSVMSDLFIFIFIGGVSAVFLLVMVLLTLVKKFKEKIILKLLDFKKKFLFNGLLRSITVSYVKVLMTAGFQF